MVDALEQTVVGLTNKMPWVSKHGEAYAKRMKENKTIVESQIALWINLLYITLMIVYIYGLCKI